MTDQQQLSAESCDAATLADKIAAWSPSSKGPLVFIARERRLIEDALRTFSDAQAVGEPVAFVPIHPRQGPLWSDTIPAGSEIQRSNNYPRMALYASQPSPAATVETRDAVDVLGDPHDHCDAPHPNLSAGNGGDFCTYGPPAERKRRWIILFDDPDKGTMVFDDEKEAHAAWDRAKDNWTCTLFETSERKYQWAAGQLRPLNEPQQLTVTRECQCAHPMIECGQTGCRCRICGEPERLPSQVSRPKPSTGR